MGKITIRVESLNSFIIDLTTKIGLSERDAIIPGRIRKGRPSI